MVLNDICKLSIDYLLFKKTVVCVLLSPNGTPYIFNNILTATATLKHGGYSRICELRRIALKNFKSSYHESWKSIEYLVSREKSEGTEQRIKMWVSVETCIYPIDVNWFDFSSFLLWNSPKGHLCITCNKTCVCVCVGDICELKSGKAYQWKSEMNRWA